MSEEIIVDLNRELPIKLDLRAYLDDGFRFRLELKLNTTGTAAALNLTNATWELIVSTERGGTAKLSTSTTADWVHSGVHVDTAASGYVTLNITAADMALIGKGLWYWALKVTLPVAHAELPSLPKTLYVGALDVWDDATA